MTYFLIRGGEDGISIEQYNSVDKLLKDIKPDKDSTEDIPFLDYVPEIDKGYFYENNLPDYVQFIIKGKIVVPKEKKRVLEWDIE